MKLFLATASTAALLAAPGLAATLSGSIGYGLNSEKTAITVFEDLGADLSMGQNQRTITLNQRVDALAYRPVTGELLAYRVGAGEGDDQVFTVNVVTGMLNSVGATVGMGANMSPNFGSVGFDFNNSLDAARAINGADQNNVFFPAGFGGANDNSIQRFNDLFYADGDVNAGVNPRIFGNAYTNAVDGMTVSETLQYALDARTNSLVTLANNAGTLNTVATITLNGEEFDISDTGGFEILSDRVGDNLAIAALSAGGETSGLYTIDLGTGAATLFADLGYDRYASFAAQTAVAPVPLPAGGVLLITALGALGYGARRRAKA